MRKVIVLLALLFLTAAGAADARELALKECLERAGATSRELRSASHEIQLSEEQVALARSGRLPRVDLQAGYVVQKDPQAIQFGALSQTTQDPRYRFMNFSVYQTLYDFGRTKAREGAARAQREAAEFSYSGTEQDVFLQVVRAYYGILVAQKLVQAANEEVAQMTSHQKTAQALYDQGVVTRNDLLQAEVRVASSRQNLYASLNEVENGWLLLNYLIGMPPEFRGTLKEEAPAPALPGPETVADFSRRGEISALKSVVKADEQVVKEAKTNYYPEFFAKFGIDYVENSKVREQAIYAGTLGLKVNLFEGYATDARVRQAVQSRLRDEERLRDVEERVRLEYATAVNDMKVAQSRIKVAEKAIVQGEENLRINRDRYQEQVGTATEVIDAQTLLTRVRSDYFQSIFDLQVASARVKRATGDL